MARHRPSGFTHFGIELAVRMTLLHFGRCVYRVIATFTAARPGDQRNRLLYP